MGTPYPMSSSLKKAHEHALKTALLREALPKVIFSRSKGKYGRGSGFFEGKTGRGKGSRHRRPPFSLCRCPFKVCTAHPLTNASTPALPLPRTMYGIAFFIQYQKWVRIRLHLRKRTQLFLPIASDWIIQ